jgi:hypothetical protein
MQRLLLLRKLQIDGLNLLKKQSQRQLPLSLRVKMSKRQNRLSKPILPSLIWILITRPLRIKKKHSRKLKKHKRKHMNLLRMPERSSRKKEFPYTNLNLRLEKLNSVRNSRTCGPLVQPAPPWYNLP